MASDNQQSPARKGELREFLKDVWAEGGRGLFWSSLLVASGLGFWIYAIIDLFQRDKVLEAAAAFILVPLGALYGLGRFFGWW